MPEYPRIIKEVKVYGRGRIQIPTQILRDLHLRDGDRVRWVEWRAGSFLLEPKVRTGHRFIE